MRFLSLPLLGGCAFICGMLAVGMSFFVGVTPLESFAVGGISMILMIFIMDTYVRSQQHSSLTQALEQFYKLQETIVQKLTTLENNQTEVGTQEIVSEIRLLHSLVTHIVEEENITTPHQHPISVQLITPADQALEADLAHPSGQTIEMQNYTPDQLLKIIKDALQEDRIDMLMQPIVSLPQRKVRAFECYSRLRDAQGAVVVPDHYLELAAEKDFIRIIDNTLLFRCVQLVRKAIKKDLSVKFFCNLSLATLRDKMFLESFIEFLACNAALAPNLIFEVEFEAILQEDPPTLTALSRLAAQGCRFSVDHIPNLMSVDFGRLKECAVGFLKIDIKLILEAAHAQNPPLSLRAFKERATQHNMDLIVTKIEGEKDLLEILDYQFDYGQGYLFGKPRLHR